MTQLPRIRLRTIFLLFVCAAVGLACATAPQPEIDPIVAGIVPQSRFDWLAGLITAISTATIFGLGQQMCQLLQSKTLAHATGNLAVAKWYAIIWRGVVAATMSAGVAAWLFLPGQLSALRDQRDVFWHDIFPNQLLVVCLIIVLSNSIDRWKQPTARAVMPRWRWVAAWVTGSLLVLIPLPDTALLPFLIHLATAGIEAYQPGTMQRAGAFPDHAAEGFRTFWTSLAAVVVVVLSAMAWTSLGHQDTGRRRTLKVGTFVVLLSIAAVFCVWYYLFERHRISPDLAVGGFPATWLDWLGASTLAAFAVSVAAWRTARSDHTIEVISHVANHRDRVSLHEAFPVQMLLLAAALCFIVGTVNSWIAIPLGITTLADLVHYSFRDQDMILYLALGLLSLHLCWVRWRKPTDTFDWRLNELDRRRFVCNWLAMAAIVVVGIPTISAYCFAFWLGPWYLYGS